MVRRIGEKPEHPRGRHVDDPADRYLALPHPHTIGNGPLAAPGPGVGTRIRSMTENVGYEHMREAIGVMTAWSSSGDAAFAAAYYNRLLDEYGVEKAREVVAGLINLCGELLALRAKEKGIGESETLREIAARIADR
jgi:hypothetical protein